MSSSVTANAIAARGSDTTDFGPRVLVASYFGHGWPSGGAVIVDSLLAHIPDAKYVRFSVALRHRGPERSEATHALHVPGLFHPRWQGAATRFLWHLGSRIQARQGIRLAEHFRADVAWAVLDYMWVPFTYRFMTRCNLPVHLSVHDDPASSASLAGWPLDVVRKIERGTEFCYRHAHSRDVISGAMRERYLDLFARDAVVVTRGIRDLPIPHGRTSPSRPARIVHAGNLLYPDETLSFARALHASGAGTLTLIGNVPARVLEAAAPLGVEIIPWISQDELRVRLKAFDFAYLPYGFSEKRKVFVETSFPTKLISYLEAGMPIIHHAPAYSSVAAFMKSYGIGVLLETAIPGDLRSLLGDITSADYSRMCDETSRAVREVFAEDQIVRRWSGALNAAHASDGASTGARAPLNG